MPRTSEEQEYVTSGVRNKLETDQSMCLLASTSLLTQRGQWQPRARDALGRQAVSAAPLLR